MKMLKKNGWRVVRISGSHHLMQKDDKTVPIPMHGKKDLGKGLLNAILKQTGLK